MVSRRIVRSAGAASLLAVALVLLVAADALAAVGWSPRYPLPPHDTGALARTYGPGQGWEHTLLYSGGYLSTSRSADGKKWSAPIHLGPSGRGSDDRNGSWFYGQPGLASSGSHLYAIWAYTNVFEKVVYWSEVSFRTSAAHGAPSSWRARVGIAVAPVIENVQIAAVGHRVVVAFSRNDMQRNDGWSVALTTSDDYGATWAAATAGPGRLRALAVTPTTIAVAIDDGAGTTIETSPDRGTTWSPDIALNGYPYVSMASGSGAIALAWADGADPGPTGLFLRMWSGTWGDVRTVARFDLSTVALMNGPIVALAGSSTVGIAWARVRPAGSAYEDLMWRESADGGLTWHAAVVLKYAVRSGPWWSDSPRAVGWAAAKLRFVVFTSGGPTTTRDYLRIGTGSP